MSITTTSREKSFAVAANRVVLVIGRHWLFIFIVISGLYAGLPWLAPIFMKYSWADAGSAIYTIYATQCQQLPERSYFLFGGKSMYSLAEVQAVWQNTNNPHILRQFIGNPEIGWKVAWSDRMVSLYTMIFIGSLLYGLVRKQIKPLPIWAYALITLPMFIDVGTHMASDMAGIGNGFRDSNIWLIAMTGHLFPAWFYAGDSLGSFNSWMRLITGFLFGIGSVWLFYPYSEQALAEIVHKIETKFRKAGLPL